MGLVDSIIGVESGGNPNAHLSTPSVDVSKKFRALPLIGKLLFASGPSAILWRVVSVHINAVNRMIGRRLCSHISKKVREAVAPAFANLNAPRSVVFVGDVFGVFAPRNHREPSSVLRGSGLATTDATRRAVGGVGRFCRFDLVTTATLGIAGLKVGYGREGLVAAVANTFHEPNRRAGAILSEFRLCLRNGSQLSKSHSGVILAGHI